MSKIILGNLEYKKGKFYDKHTGQLVHLKPSALARSLARVAPLVEKQNKYKNKILLVKLDNGKSV